MKQVAVTSSVFIRRPRGRAISLVVTFRRSEKVYKLDKSRLSHLRRHACHDCEKPLSAGDYVVTIAGGTNGVSIRCLSCACRYLQPDIQIIEQPRDRESSDEPFIAPSGSGLSVRFSQRAPT